MYNLKNKLLSTNPEEHSGLLYNTDAYARLHYVSLIFYAVRKKSMYDFWSKYGQKENKICIKFYGCAKKIIDTSGFGVNNVKRLTT